MIAEFATYASGRTPVSTDTLDRVALLCGGYAPPLPHDALLGRMALRAAAIAGSCIGLVTLVRDDRLIFAGGCGTELGGVAREESFCDHTIRADVPLVVEDALADERFRRLDLVTEPPFVRAYVGAPILDANGVPLGTVCALHTSPIRPTSAQLLGLSSLAVLAGTAIEARRLIGGSVGPEGRERTLSRLDGLLARLLPPAR